MHVLRREIILRTHQTTKQGEDATLYRVARYSKTEMTVLVDAPKRRFTPSPKSVIDDELRKSPTSQPSGRIFHRLELFLDFLENFIHP